MSGSSDDGLIRGPHPSLRAFVGDYVGYDIAGLPAGMHLGLPSGALTFIVSIHEPLHQYDETTHDVEGFEVLFAGLHMRRTLIRHDGAMSGIQINFSPFAPRVFFDIPAAQFAHHSVAVTEVAPQLAVELHERVNAAPTWPERFLAIDHVLTRVLRSTNGPRPEVVEAWRLIAHSHGGVPVSVVAQQVGWSRRHLASQFRAELGIGPKEAARVLRFDRARRLIGTNTGTLAEIAAACGYFDQSHLDREFRALTGTSPTGWLRTDAVARVSPSYTPREAGGSTA